MMFCRALVSFSQFSLTVQVQVIIPQPSTTELTSLKPTSSVLSQLSVAVTIAASGTSVHATVIFPGTPTSVGATLSSTVIVCTALVSLPQLSLTVQVRVIIPQPSTTELTSRSAEPRVWTECSSRCTT